MSDTSKNETTDVSIDELSIKEGDIVWHIEDKYIGIVISIFPRLKSKPFLYIIRLAGYDCSDKEPTQDKVELLLSKEQIQYEEVISGTTVKAFYKGKMVLDLVFISEIMCKTAYHALNIVKRNYICKQLLEMYPDTKISEAITKSWC